MFKVGDKVSRNKTQCIGTVVKITDKRKDVVVDFGNFKETYTQNGWTRSSSGVWNSSCIYLLTEELKKELDDKARIKACKYLLVKTQERVTAENAKRIIDFLTKECWSEE